MRIGGWRRALATSARRARPPTPAPLPSGTGVAAGSPLFDAMGYDPIGLEALLARTGMDVAELQARLMALELEGHVARLPGGLYQRVVLA